MYVFVATALYRIIHIVANPFEIITYYYHYLINHMDADSVSHMMHNDHLITKEDYQAITAAPNDSQMNIAIMEYVRAMDLSTLYKFTDLLINMETQQSIGNTLKTGTCACRMLFIHV